MEGGRRQIATSLQRDRKDIYKVVLFYMFRRTTQDSSTGLLDFFFCMHLTKENTFEDVKAALGRPS
jgi:hypothetical protein